MKKYYFILIIMLGTISSFSQSFKSLDFRINIFPSSGGEYGYVIEAKGSTYKISIKKLIIENEKIIFGNTLEIKTKKLSNSQINKIRTHIEGVKKLNQLQSNVEPPLDVWVYDLLIEEKQSLIINSSIINQSEFVKFEKLLKYLKKISPIKMNIKQFS